uniref:Uncharacterized protein n=1 Tax=Oryza barthii TaxID=65489 RepID=A0A0D3GL36_9ORYZ
MHGTVYANYAVDNTDLLLAFGVRFDDRTNRQNRCIREEGKLTTAEEGTAVSGGGAHCCRRVSRNRRHLTGERGG